MHIPVLHNYDLPKKRKNLNKIYRRTIKMLAYITVKGQSGKSTTTMEQNGDLFRFWQESQKSFMSSFLWETQFEQNSRHTTVLFFYSNHFFLNTFRRLLPWPSFHVPKPCLQEDLVVFMFWHHLGNQASNSGYYTRVLMNSKSL